MDAIFSVSLCREKTQMYTVTYPHPPPGGGGERLEFEPSCVESTHKSAPYFGNIAEHLIIAAGDRKNSSRRRVLG